MNALNGILADVLQVTNTRLPLNNPRHKKCRRPARVSRERRPVVVGRFSPNEIMLSNQRLRVGEGEPVAELAATENVHM
jgi:hypothetical protein